MEVRYDAPVADDWILHIMGVSQLMTLGAVFFGVQRIPRVASARNAQTSKGDVRQHIGK
jgi:hypothetical protein